MKRVCYLFLSSTVISFFFVTVAHAVDYVPLLNNVPGVSGSNINGEAYIRVLYVIAVVAAAFIAVIKLILAGFNYVTSSVVSQKSDAKKDIINALFGLLIIIAATAILTTINPSISSLPALTPVEIPPTRPIAKPVPLDASGIEELRQACLAKKSEGYKFITYTGTWDNPIDGVDCCIPGATSGEGMCRNANVVNLNGVELVEGTTYLYNDYTKFIQSLRDAGVNLTETGVLIADIEDQKTVCEFGGGTPYIVKRERSPESLGSLSSETRLICVKS